MNPSSPVAENGTASAPTEVSTFQIQAGGRVQSPSNKWAHHFAHRIEVEIRGTLSDHGLHASRIEPKIEHIRERRYFWVRLRRIKLTMTCHVEGTAEEMKRVRDDLKLALLHLPATRIKLRDVFAAWEMHQSPT